MNVNFILNGEDVAVETWPERRLIDILRLHFSLLGAKCGCLTGKCGSCSVVFNGLVTQSCLIPAFRVIGGEVVTIEGFAQTEEYREIVQGFADAGVETCGYCDTGKVLAVEALLGRNADPGRAEAFAALAGVKCRCTEPESLTEAILAIADKRRRRAYGRA